MAKKVQKQVQRKVKPRAAQRKKANSKIERPLQSLWEKHAMVIEKSGLKTVRELAVKLKESRGNKSGVAGISRTEAAKMLIDIALTAVPLSIRFRDQIQKKFQGVPEKVNFPAIVSELKKMITKAPVNYETKKYFFDMINTIEADKVKDPLEDPLPLEDYQLTAIIFLKKIVHDVAILLGVSADEADKLSAKYQTPRTVLIAKPEDIAKTIGISFVAVQAMQIAFCWFLGRKNRMYSISVALAAALAKASVTPTSAISLKPAALKKKLTTAGIQVPGDEITDEGLKSLIDEARKAFPDISFFQDVMPLHKLSDEVQETLEKKGIDTFEKLRKAGIIEDIVKHKKIYKKAAKSLLAYSRLAKLTYNVGLATALIDDGIYSVFKVGKFSLKEFKKKYKDKAGDDELDQVHRKAVKIIGKNMPVAAWANLIARDLGVDRMVPGNTEARTLANKIMKGIIQ